MSDSDPSTHNLVIPANAGTQLALRGLPDSLGSRVRGNDEGEGRR